MAHRATSRGHRSFFDQHEKLKKARSITHIGIAILFKQVRIRAALEVADVP
jgi:hypothetical protein